MFSVLINLSVSNLEYAFLRFFSKFLYFVAKAWKSRSEFQFYVIFT